jgi:hypothetical protein
VTISLASDEVAHVVGELSGDLEVVVRVDKNKGSGRNAELRRSYTDKKKRRELPPAARRSLTQGTITKRLGSPLKAYRLLLC